jgi:hypothetical protein
MQEASSAAKLSVIVPVGTRQSDIAELFGEYAQGVEATGLTAEFIFVLDGPFPKVAEQLRELAQRDKRITIVGLNRFVGEATALMVGFEHSQGDIIVTLPAYHQIDASGIGLLVAGLATSDVTTAHRWPRRGGIFERARRSLFHSLLSSMTGMRLRDLGCGARAMKRQVLKEITLYGDQHRFLPVLANRQGFRVAEVDVPQSASDRFSGVYRARDYAHRFLDIFTVFFLVRFTKKPLRFFGMVGVVTFVIGAVLLTYLVGARLFFGVGLADRPALLLSSLLVVLGLQVFAIGLLGELVIFTHAKDMKDYQVDSVIEFPTDRGE